MKKDELYLITCAEPGCNVVYEYRLHTADGLIYKTNQKPKGDFTEHVSHGLCLDHLVENYKRNDIELPTELRRSVK